MVKTDMVPRAVLKEMQNQMAMMQASLEKVTKQNEEQCAYIQKQDERIRELEQMLANAQRARFGQRSEKSRYVLSGEAQQLGMFDEESSKNQAALEAENDAASKEITVAEHKRRPKRTKEEQFKNLEQEKRVVDLPEAEKVNANGKPLKCIGEKEIRKEVEYTPAKAVLVTYCMKVYADVDFANQYGDTPIIMPDPPAALIPNSYVSPSLATEVIVRKFADGLPLYRQEQIWKRYGLPLKRNTMANWVITLANHYLRRLWKRIKEELLKQGVIHADETVLQVLKEEGRAPTAQSRMWVYASGKRAAVQLRIFEYRDNRNGDSAVAFLGDYEKIVVSDGYSGYNKLNKIVRAGCWAHMQRKWREAMPKGEIGEKSTAAQGYRYCNRLFAMERKFADLSDEERLAKRREKSQPIVEAYYKWIETLTRPSGKLKDAITYALNQKAYLCAFLDHGEVELSNNQVENAIRPLVVGRKGWLFCDTPEGAEATAVLYTILETAKANHLNPETYLRHLLTTLPQRQASKPECPIDDLLPWSDAMQKQFKTAEC
jgi:transposase